MKIENKDNLADKITVKCSHCGEVKTFTIQEMLTLINENTSADWEDYAIEDWEEGMREWTNWVLVE